jgi:hypothetical protein
VIVSGDSITVVGAVAIVCPVTLNELLALNARVAAAANDAVSLACVIVTGDAITVVGVVVVDCSATVCELEVKGIVVARVVAAAAGVAAVT